MNAEPLRGIARTVAAVVLVVAAVVGLPLVTALLPVIPVWLAATIVAGIVLVFITIAVAHPSDPGDSPDDTDA